MLTWSKSLLQDVTDDVCNENFLPEPGGRRVSVWTLSRGRPDTITPLRFPGHLSSHVEQTGEIRLRAQESRAGCPGLGEPQLGVGGWGLSAGEMR